MSPTPLERIVNFINDTPQTQQELVRAVKKKGMRVSAGLELQLKQELAQLVESGVVVRTQRPYDHPDEIARREVFMERYNALPGSYEPHFVYTWKPRN